jgi:hypothetical protein
MSGAEIAEELLFTLAAELRFVPIEERTMRLHLRALELKREVRAWQAAAHEREPTKEEIGAVMDEIRRLAGEVGTYGKKRVHGRANSEEAQDRPFF